MNCPFCGHLHDKVVDSRESKEGDAIRRRRQCLVEYDHAILPGRSKRDRVLQRCRHGSRESDRDIRRLLV